MKTFKQKTVQEEDKIKGLLMFFLEVTVHRLSMF